LVQPHKNDIQRNAAIRMWRKESRIKGSVVRDGYYSRQAILRIVNLPRRAGFHTPLVGLVWQAPPGVSPRSF
jgi:hypothetical protein